MPRSAPSNPAKSILLFTMNLLFAATMALTLTNPVFAASADFGPASPFYAPSTLPFQAPPFDKIKDEDFQPAIEAGMAQQQAKSRAIADNPDAPTFDNTIRRHGKERPVAAIASSAAFAGVTGANTNPTLQKIKTIEAPKLAAHEDFIYLNAKLFARVAAIYKQRAPRSSSIRSLCAWSSTTTTSSSTPAPIFPKPTRPN